MENIVEFESEGDDLSIATKSKCYSNIVYSIRRHAEAIQLVHIILSFIINQIYNNLYYSYVLHQICHDHRIDTQNTAFHTRRS